jgi:hypothetical protein
MWARIWVSGIVSAAVLGLALVAALPAQAQMELASCTGEPDGVFTVGGVIAQEVAETFTIPSDATANAVRLGLVQNDLTPATGDFTVRIFTADGTGPTGTSLATGTFPVPGAPDTVGSPPVTVDLASPAALVAGQLYAIVVTRTGAGDAAITFADGDPCPANTLFLREGSSGPWMADSTGDDFFFAVLAPDAPSPPPPDPPDTNTPEATITKGPKNKTRKKKATFEFAGTDARAVASFQCKLDGEAFAPCTSPHTVRVKKGKHTFQVQAIDQAGNIGQPATDTWKRKKKK